MVIGFGTGAEFEAILMDKPVIDLNYNNLESDLYGFEAAECVITVKDPSELTNVIKNVLTNKEIQEQLAESRKNYIEYSISKFDGNASKRIKNLIMEIVN